MSAVANPDVSPTLRVVAGSPSDEEIAVVTAVLLSASRGSTAPARPSAEASMWGRPAHVRLGRPRSWGESRLPR